MYPVHQERKTCSQHFQIEMTMHRQILYN